MVWVCNVSWSATAGAVGVESGYFLGGDSPWEGWPLWQALGPLQALGWALMDLDLWPIRLPIRTKVVQSDSLCDCDLCFLNHIYDTPLIGLALWLSTTIP